MLLPDISLTKDDFVQSHWEKIISESEKKECLNYSTLFFAKSQEAGTTGNIKAQGVFALLAAITACAIRPESNDEFFSDKFKHLRDEHLNVLGEVAPAISDAEMRARIADILWVRKRYFRMAQLAITSYLESANILEDPHNWTSCVDRIERSIRLARKVNHHFADVVTHIETVLDKYNGEDPLWLSAKLMELLQEYRQGDPSKYAALAEKAATLAEAVHDWSRARAYWEIKARWHAQENNTEDNRTALMSLAETYVQESEDARTHPSIGYTTASFHLQKAIEAFRRIGGTKAKERVEALHKVLVEYQQKSPPEMISVSQEMDISHLVEAAREKVRGKGVYDAIFTLAIEMGRSPNVTDIRQQVEKSPEDFLLQMMPMVMKNEMGKVTGRQTSSEDAMFRRAVYYQQIQAQVLIEPARSQINLEHDVRVNDFLPIVANNPFVPQGREYIYAKGFHAGLTGDFLVSAHLLIPQIENSVRYLLNQRGVVTSSLDDQGIQNEKDINTLLYLDEVKSIFSEDILFDLQGLLIKRFGSNLRNEMAHGLIDEDGFFSVQVSYLWWLTLRLCCLPVLAQMQTSQSDQRGTSEDSET